MALEKIGVRATIEGLSAFNRGMRDMKRGIISVGDASMTAAKRTETLNKALKLTGTALLAASAASGALLYSSVKLAARVETLGVVTKVLGKNVGKTEKEIRDLEQAIVDEGITLRGARQSIALMIQSNIDLGKSTDLATEAQNAAVIAGVNSSEAFERLVYTITSGSVRMARTLGLQVSFQRAHEETAKALGKTTEELTEQEKVQARTNEVIRAGVNIEGAYAAAMETAGKQVTSMDRLIEESKRTLGEAWLPVYAKVIKFISDSLKVWLSLTQGQKNIVSSTLGVVTAFGALFGIVALILSKVSAAVAGFQALATAVAGTGTIVFSATAVLGIYIAAILAVGVAIVKVVQFISMIKQRIQEVDAAFVEHEKHMRDTAGSYEDYRKEMIRAGLLVALTKLNQRELNNAMREGGEEAVLAAAGIEYMSKEVFTAHQNAAELEKRTDGWKGSIRGAGLEIATTTGFLEKFGRTQEEIKADIDELNKVISLDITDQFKDYAERVKELTDRMGELSKITDPTQEQRDDLKRTQEELRNLEAQWDETTAKIIFDLAQQRLAIDGFTEEELSALRKLAGPEGLGLIDEAAVELLNNIDILAGHLDLAGDQSEIFAEQAVGLRSPLLNASGAVDALANAIGRLKSKTVVVTYKQKTYVETIKIVSRAPSRLPSQVRQTGGFLQSAQASVVGERGPEVFVPRRSGMVLNNRFVGAINSLVAALKSAPMLMSAPMSGLASSSVTNNSFNMNINTRAATEPIVSDFRAMQSMANAF